MQTTTIYLVRHGEVHNPKDIFYARLPRFRLSARGREEAERTARFLKRRAKRNAIRAMYSSPMLRARQTAQIIQRYHPDAVLHISQDLNELRTDYQGAGRAELDAIGWDFYAHRRHESDETREDVLARMRRLLQRTVRQHAGRAVVWVSHGDPVMIFTVWAHGLPMEALQERRRTNYVAHASVTEFVFERGRELPVRVKYHHPNG